MSELISKAEELSKVLKRCCTLVSIDNQINSSSDIIYREKKELKCLTKQYVYRTEYAIIIIIIIIIILEC